MGKLRIIGFSLMLTIILLTGCSSNQSHREINELIANGNNEEVIKLVEDGYDINKRYDNVVVSILTENDDFNCSPLYTACQVSNYEMIKFLLNNGADPNYSGYNTEYPLELFLSTSYNDKEAFDLFLEKGADIEKHEIKTPMCALMMHYARADKEHQEIIENEIRELISLGIDWRNDNLDEQYGGYSILHFVAVSDRVDFMQELLEDDEAADCINSVTASGKTPYNLAKQNNQEEMCKLLENQRY